MVPHNANYMLKSFLVRTFIFSFVIGVSHMLKEIQMTLKGVEILLDNLRVLLFHICYKISCINRLRHFAPFFEKILLFSQQTREITKRKTLLRMESTKLSEKFFYIVETYRNLYFSCVGRIFRKYLKH